MQTDAAFWVAAAVLVAGILLFTATGAFAAGSNDSQPLDIQHIVSITAVPGSCQVEPATLVYLDSQGTSHTVEYTVMGTCQGGV